MPAERRRIPRQGVLWKGTIYGDQGSVLAPCLMTNVSANGANLTVDPGINVPDEFVLTLARNAGVRRHCEVVWRTAASIGVRFVAPPR